MGDNITIKICPHNALGFQQKIVTPTTKLQGLYQHDVDYYYDGEKINPESTIGQLQLIDGDYIQTYSKNKPMYELDLKFKMLTGVTHQIVVDHVWTLRKVSRMLQELSGTKAESMKFIFAGRVLIKNKAFMNDSGIMKGSTIHVLIG